MSRKTEYITLGQARSRLRKCGVIVSQRTLRRWVENGRLNAHHRPERPKQAGQWLLDVETVAALANSMKDNRR